MKIYSATNVMILVIHGSCVTLILLEGGVSISDTYRVLIHLGYIMDTFLTVYKKKLDTY
jgi:hypothetical protein